MDSIQQAGPLSRWCCWTSVNSGIWGTWPEGTVCFCDVTGGQTDDGAPNAGWPFSCVSLLWKAVRGLHAQLPLPDLSSAGNAGVLHTPSQRRKEGGPGSESSVHHV